MSSSPPLTEKEKKADKRNITHKYIETITSLTVIICGFLLTLPAVKNYKHKKFIYYFVYILVFVFISNAYAKAHNARNTFEARKYGNYYNDYKLNTFVDTSTATIILAFMTVSALGPNGFKVFGSRGEFRGHIATICIYVFIVIAFVIQHKYTKTRVDFMRDGSGFTEYYINSVQDVYSLETYTIKPVFEHDNIYKENPVVNKETYTTKLAVYDTEDKCPDTYIDEGDGKKSSDGSYCISLKNVDFNYSNASDLSRYSVFYDKGKTMSSTTCEDDNCIYIPIIKNEVNRQESGSGTSSMEKIIGFKNRKGDNLLDVMIDDIWSERINVNDPVLQKVIGHMWAYSNSEGVGVVYRDAIKYFEYDVPNNKKKFPNRLGKHTSSTNKWNDMSESEKQSTLAPYLKHIYGGTESDKNHAVSITDIVGVHEDENYSRNIFYMLCAMKAQGFPRPKYIYIDWNLAVYGSPELDADNN